MSDYFMNKWNGFCKDLMTSAKLKNDFCKVLIKNFAQSKKEKFNKPATMCNETAPIMKDIYHQW